jgi:hypothetical protein
MQLFCIVELLFCVALLRLDSIGKLLWQFQQNRKEAAEMLLEEKVHPEQLIDRVTTPQGCTIAGLNGNARF